MYCGLCLGRDGGSEGVVEGLGCADMCPTWRGSDGKAVRTGAEVEKK